MIDIKNVRASTLNKYNIKLGEKTNKYISEWIKTCILLIIMYLEQLLNCNKQSLVVAHIIFSFAKSHIIIN